MLKFIFNHLTTEIYIYFIEHYYYGNEGSIRYQRIKPLRVENSIKQSDNYS